jgi:hypothetical protein
MSIWPNNFQAESYEMYYLLQRNHPFRAKEDRRVKFHLGKVRQWVTLGVIFISLSIFIGLTSVAQERKFPQTAGVDDSKMGTYRALAQLAFAASQKGDNVLAAKLARILERDWDKAEDYGGESALSKTNHALFDEIDRAMDHFIAPLTAHIASAPDPVTVKAAFNAYLEKLKQAD